MNTTRKDFFLRIAVYLWLVTVLTALAGCGHNHLIYGDGFSVKTTIDPELWSAGVCVQYGKILSATVRENVALEMTGDGSGSVGSDGKSDTSAAATGSVKLTVGSQVTGYTVDLERAKPAAK